MKSVIVIILSLILSITQAGAQSKWNIDASHSNIQFTVSHMVVAEVTGRFKDFAGTVTASKEDFSDGKAQVTIKVNSIDTDNLKRDEHLKSEDFFDAAKFPEITFTNTGVSIVSGNKYKITGNLTMKGVTKSVELDAVYRGQVNDPWGGTRAGWKAKSSLDRFDYGLTWNKAIETGGLVVGRTIDMDFNIELIKEK